LVEAESPESRNEVVFAPGVATRPHGPFTAGARSTSKPSSSSELSNQARAIWLEETAVADKLLGEEGGLPAVGVAVGVAVVVGGTGVGVEVGVGVAVGGIGVGVEVAGGDVGVEVGVAVAVGGSGVGVEVGVEVDVGVEVGSGGIGVGVGVGVCVGVGVGVSAIAA
jgi:hypothetical protein